MYKTRKQTKYLFMAAAAAVLAAVLFLLCYRYDNKYTWRGVQPSNGVLVLDEQAIANNPVMFLIDGWELYQNKLLSPEDFTENPPIPDQYVFIGQYGGFEAGDTAKSPHGSAAYRLNIFLPDEEKSYMLELPEIYSAYKLYINGKLMAGFGQPEPDAYQPETGNGSVVFEAGRRVEIIVAVSDFSHFYSGMVYPPAFGEPEAVSRLLYVRFAFRMLICAIALVIGILSLLIGALSKDARLTAIYGLTCLFFIGYTCYPVAKTLVRSGPGWYSFEHFCYTAMFLTVMLLQNKICGVKTKWSKVFFLFGGSMCVFSLISAVFITGNLRLIMAYSYLIAAYKYAAAAYLTISAAYAAYKGNPASKIILTGLLVFDCALIMDRILPMFEPIRFGWFVELAGFALVLSIGAVMGFAVAEQYRARLEADEHARSVSRLVEIQRGYYPMITERINEIKAARHDLRHHLTVVQEFVEGGEYQRLSEYITAFQGDLRQNTPLTYCEHYVANVILHHYAERARAQGVIMAVRADIPDGIGIPDSDICAVLSNLLENAIEACASMRDSGRWITAEAAQDGGSLVIEVKNSFDGIIQAEDRRFLSRKERGREGIGLLSVRAMSEKYNGSVYFEPDSERGVFHSSVMLNVP